MSTLRLLADHLFPNARTLTVFFSQPAPYHSPYSLVAHPLSAVPMLLQKKFPEREPKDYYDILYDHLKSNSLPTNMLNEVVLQSRPDEKSFDKLFSPLLSHIREQKIALSITNSSHRESLSVLTYLCEFSTSFSRPFCDLMTRLDNWLIVRYTNGREFVDVTYLGPFFSTSLFEDDDPGLFSGSSPNSEIVLKLQQEIELTRTLLHKVHTSIQCTSCPTKDDSPFTNRY